ncbi:MAG: hypothetical protein WB729_11260 [Candidatus Sulfotelmatobacter sp.]
MRCWLILFLTLIQAQTSLAFQTGQNDQKKSPQTSTPPSTNPTASVTPDAASAHSDQNKSNSDSANAVSARRYCGVIRGYSADKSELQLADRSNAAATAMGSESCDPGPAVEIQVQGQSLKDGLTNWKPGDQVIATVTVSKNGTAELVTLQDIQAQVLQVKSWEPAVALFSFPLLVFLLTIFSRSVRELLFIGQDGRWSNSTTQISLWFTLWVSAYIATFALRWTSGYHLIGSITTPSALLALSGLSGLTFAGAKGITANKVANQSAAAPGSAPVAPAAGATPAVAVPAVAPVSPAPGGVPASVPATGITAARLLPDGKRNSTKASTTSLADLLKDDQGNFDFGDFQMLVMTLIAVASYGIVAYHFLGALEARVSVSLPDVDGTVLAMFGVGQGAYLAKKASTGIDQ